MHNAPYWMPKTRSKRLVGGLVESESPNPVKVFKMNPDGSLGELLRIEESPKPTEHRYEYYREYFTKNKTK